MPWSRALLVALCVLGLSACTTGGRNFAPVQQATNEIPQQPVQSPKPVQKTEQRPALYKVRAGDTLYSIAWRYGLDYREFARWNVIDPPYVIFPGQPLVLDSSAAPPKPIPRVAASPTREPAAPRVTRATRSHFAVMRPRPKAKPRNIVAIARSSSNPRAIRATNQVAAKPPQRAKPRASVAELNRPVKRWQWPARGKLLRTFRQTKKTGIDISGQPGTQVVAAAPGRVVYSGSGLRGYGQLIIIKHNDRFLSAYAHNAKLHVAEGEDVGAGQHVADMGRSGTDRVMLHFEIRRDGKPVNPLPYLKQR